MMDGTLDEVDTTYYNEFSERSRTESDRDADGQIDSISTRIFDEDGKLLREELDRTLDGRADGVYTYQYNDIGLVARREYYEGNFTRPQWWLTWEYDSVGRLQRRSVFGRGGNEITHYKYNERGELVRMEEDINADGRIDGYATYRWDDGLLVELGSFVVADSSFDSVTVLEYDEERRLIRSQSGSHKIRTYTYEPSTGWLSIWTYTLGGHVEAVLEYRYDAVGREVKSILTDYAGRRHARRYQNDCPFTTGMSQQAGPAGVAMDERAFQHLGMRPSLRLADWMDGHIAPDPLRAVRTIR